MKVRRALAVLVPVVVLALDDAYLLAQPFNACTIHAPYNLLAVFASGIPVSVPVLRWLFGPQVPDYAIVLTGNVIVLAVYIPLSLWLTGLLSRRHRRSLHTAEPGAPPNGGPAERLSNSGVGGGPPSVS